MTAPEDALAAVRRSPRVAIEARFERHVSRSWAHPLTGSRAGGRWGPSGAFPVLYLGRPRRSVVVEAYRHLVDPFEGMTGDMVQPRRLVVVDVTVTEVLDLRSPEHLEAVGLTVAEVASPVGSYETCWRVATAAHQLNLHGVLATAATGLGETLALFEDQLPPAEHPRHVGEEVWERLPPDPRRVRAIDEDTG